MKKILCGLITLFILVLNFQNVFAKYESGSQDASSSVLYGQYNGTIIPIKVDSDGKVVTSGGSGSGVVGTGSTNQIAYYQSGGTSIVGTPTMIIKDGNVGIGTDTPRSRLHIGSGSVLFQTVNQGMAFGDTSIQITRPQTTKLFLDAGAAHLLLKSDSGYVGIGITDPTSQLHVTGDGSVDIDGTKLVVKNTGYIGVGTANPAYLFDVQGSANIANTLTVQNISVTGTEGRISDNTYTNNYIDLNDLGSGNIAMGATTRLLSGGSVGLTYSTVTPPSNGLIVQGNLGVGTNSVTTGALAVHGSIDLTNTAGVFKIGNGDVQIDDSYSVLQLKGGDGVRLQEYSSSVWNTRLLVDSAGNIGIGTNTTKAKFDARGTVNLEITTLTVNGSTGYTGATCTSFKNGICVSGS